jgi:predicted transcriptional regulator
MLNKKAEKWIGNSGMKRLTIDVEPEVHNKLKTICLMKDRTMAHTLRRAINKLIQKHDSTETQK